MTEGEIGAAEIDDADGTTPRVSIGLPVYNGDAFLEEAIESILQQTFDDLELIISDNASTDRTQEICEKAAQVDPRVRYFRQERNLGASPNYNFTFHQARGEYFKWAAHDDIIEPDHVARCVEAMDRYPEVQLAFPRTLKIDETGSIVGKYPDYASMRLMSSRPSERFGDMVCKMHMCLPFFGVMRRGVLESTELHAAREDSDRHLLADLALRGPLYEVPEYLFKRRDHAGTYSASVPLGERMAWWDTSLKDEITFPEWRSLGIYLGLIRNTPMPASERRACRLQLIRWLFTPRWYRQRWVKLLRDAVFGGYRRGTRLVRRGRAESA